MTSERIQEEEYRRGFEHRLWWRILGHARPYARSLAVLAACGLLIAAGDVLLPRLTGLVVDAAVGGWGRGEAPVSGVEGAAGTSGVAAGADPAALRRHLWQYVAVFFGMTLLVWVFIVMAGRVATGVAYDMRRRAFARLQELSFSFYDRRPVGWLMARLTSDCSRLAGLMPWFCIDLFWGTALLAGITVMMLRLDLILALCVLAMLPPLAAVSWIFQKRMLRTQREVRKVNSQLTAAFNEAIMGVRTTRTLGREAENLREFEELSASMYRHSVRNALQNAVYLPIVLGSASVGTGLALWQAGVRIESVTLGTLVTFIQYAAIFYIPIQELAARFTSLQAAQASAERLQGLLDTEPEIRDRPGAVTPVPGEPVWSSEFRNVSFAYREGKPVLRNFDLAAGAGETIALVGARAAARRP